jgi:membrane protein
MNIHKRHTLSSLVRTIGYYIKGIYKQSVEENVFFLAAGIAFNGLLCLLPFLLLFTSLFGIFLQSSIVPIQKIDELLNTAFPQLPYTQQIVASLKNVVRDVVRYRSALGLYGIGILLWASASMFSSVRLVLNRIYKISPSKMMIVAFIENVLLVMVLGSLFFVANFFTWTISGLKSFLSGLPGFEFIDFKGILKTISMIIPSVLAFSMFYIMNRFMPDQRVPSRVAAIAALTTTIFWWVAGKGFGWYLTALHPYNKLYGTYAFMIVFLFWIYYSAAVFVFGVMVGHLYRQRKKL